MTAVGVVGYGEIGAYLAGRLLQDGYDVVAYDVDERRIAAAREAGAAAGEHPADVTERTDVVVLALPGRTYVELVMEDDDGVLDALSTGQVVVDAGTTTPDLDRRYARLAAERGAGYLDAPLTWGGPGEYTEERGPAFTMFVGGRREDYERVREVIETLSYSHDHFGPAGSGHVVKAAHRTWQNCRAAVDMEVVELLRDNGVDPAAVDDLLELGIREGVLDPSVPAAPGFRRAVGRGSGDDRGEDDEPTAPGPDKALRTEDGVHPRPRTSAWAKDSGYALAVAHASNTYAPILSTVYQLQLAAENLASSLLDRELRFQDPDWADRTDTAAVYRLLDRPGEEWCRYANGE